jgi:hypothetical protein
LAFFQIPLGDGLLKTRKKQPVWPKADEKGGEGENCHFCATAGLSIKNMRIFREVSVRTAEIKHPGFVK